MPQSLDAQTYSLVLQATVNNPLALQAVAAPLNIARTNQLASGTGANQADRIWAATRTIAASGTDDLDLAGVLVDAVGTTLGFARIKGLYVAANAANTNNVLVGAAAANQFATWLSAATTSLTVRPGGAFFLFAPDATAYAVTAGTGDILRVANSAGGTSVTYDIVLIGSSA